MSSGNTVSGRVVNQNGQPVPNATVHGLGVDFEELNLQDPSDLRSKAQQLLDRAEDPIPRAWDGDLSLTGSNGAISDANSPVIAVHEREAWLGNDPNLEDVRLQVPANERIAFSAWDPTATGFVQDGGDSGLPGRSINDFNVTVEQLGPGGGITSSDTYEPNAEWVPFSSTLGDTDEYVVTSLPQGFYRVYPEDHPETSYVIAVGQPSSIIQGYATDLENRAGNLEDRAGWIEQQVNEDRFWQTRVETNATGYASLSVPSNVKLVGLTAYKGPYDRMGADPTNTSIEDIRQFYGLAKFNGSVVMPTDAEKVEPPASNITIRTREVSRPTLANLSEFARFQEYFQDVLQNESYGNVSSYFSQAMQANNQTRQELARLYNETNRLRQQNSRLNERFLTLLNETRGVDRDAGNQTVNVTLDPNTAPLDRLRSNITLLRRSMGELQGTISANDPTVTDRGGDGVNESELGDAISDALDDALGGDAGTTTNATAGDNTVSVRFPFNAELEPEDIAVYAQYPNGTEVAVADRYWRLDKSAVPIPAGGTEAVVVEHYPLGDASNVQFRVDVATESGLGTVEKRVTNPTFNGTTPGLAAVDLTTLRPGPDETVTARLIPEDAANFRNVTGISVTYPNGTTTAGTVDGARTASFTTAGAGSYHLEVQYANPAGQSFAVATGIEAADQDLAMPPGIRIASGPAAGTYALTGEALRGGTVDLQSGGSAASVTATIPTDAEVPGTLHVYTTGAGLQPDADLTVRIARGPDRAGISQQIRTVIHLQAPPEGTLLRRNGAPLPSGDSRFAEVTDTGGSLVIDTYTDETGTVEITSNANAGLIDSLDWQIDRTLDTLPIPTIPIPGPLTVGFAFVLPIGFVRHWTSKPPPGGAS